MTTTIARHREDDEDTALARAWTALEAVPDPEIPVVSIRELGILRDVRRASDGVLEVVITPTYSGCPAMWQIAEDIGTALDAAHLKPYRIETVLAPAWTTDWIGAEAREKLRAYGIAPPTHQCAVDGINHIESGPYARALEKVVRFAPRERVASTVSGAASASAGSLASTACAGLTAPAASATLASLTEPAAASIARASFSASAASPAHSAITAPTASAPPPCSHCGSAHTERLAQFGSTACKALYRCVDCREPFDYFKPY
ncbi:1,2-phenylacetyl-CoA epoxidase subunit PaaD [Paraburkholderia edwinii]|uniref:1,2-phenylacetyl-CoA epoxidase subunit PaaD n=1 Tax=Paraburkholderia edwinii TaxID=2861782 RepID=UPI001FEA7D03|nr:1,2-phenylacetyl-CoA epoxidase subunit PaaD [Paraburkholderia edwinii]